MPQYSLGHDPSVLLSHARRTAEDSVAYLLARLRPDMAVLDVGCGPGSITPAPAGRDAMTWYSAFPGTTWWPGVCRAMARPNGDEPDTGRRLRAWCVEAAPTDVQADASTWCRTSPEIPWQEFSS